MADSENQATLEAIAEIVGYDVLQQICSEHGGRELYLPKTLPYKIRDEQIRKDYKQTIAVTHSVGVTLKKLSFKYGLSESQIRRVVNFFQFPLEMTDGSE